MSYILQKLNVVKTVERNDQRDALLSQGFELVKVQEKPAAKSNARQSTKTEGAEK